MARSDDYHQAVVVGRRRVELEHATAEVEVSELQVLTSKFVIANKVAPYCLSCMVEFITLASLEVGNLVACRNLAIHTELNTASYENS
jgi:hypothetical protein